MRALTPLVGETTREDREAARVMFYAGAKKLLDMINECDDAADFGNLLEGITKELHGFGEQVKGTVKEMMMEGGKDGKINRGNRT